MLQQIEELISEIKNLKASNAEEAEALRIKYLGRKGLIPALFDNFKNVPAENKKAVGMALNTLKNEGVDFSVLFFFTICIYNGSRLNYLYC